MSKRDKIFQIHLLTLVLSASVFVVAAFPSLSLAASASDEAKMSVVKTTDEAPSAAPAASKFKAQFSSYFYDFQGTRAANAGLYEFADSTLKMQLMSLQYQMTPELSLTVLGQHLENYAVTKVPGASFENRTKGMGDTLVMVAKPLTMRGSFMLLGDVGVSLPTGSITEKLEQYPEVNQAYNMQMGSGTYDALLGLTALDFQKDYQWGARASATLRNGTNSRDYTLGNLYRLDAWLDVPTKVGLTPRVVAYYKHKEAIRGQDATIPRSAYKEFYYHAQINWDVSAALKYQLALSPAMSVSAEAGVPLVQDSANVDNVAVSTQYYGNLSLNGTF